MTDRIKVTVTEVQPIAVTIRNAVNIPGGTHNGTTGKQGGTTDEYYHLTEAEHTVVGSTSGANTGDQDLSGKLDHTGGTITDFAETTEAANVVTSKTLDLSAGNSIEYTQTGATEYTMPVAPAAGTTESFELHIFSQSFASTWEVATPPAIWLTDAGVAPTFNTASGKINTVTGTYSHMRAAWLLRHAGSET